jgi:hypothetical protein
MASSPFVEPGGHISGVVGSRMVGDAEIGEDETGGQLGGRLLDRACVAAEAFVEVAVETVPDTGGVTTFVLGSVLEASFPSSQ